MQNKFQFLCRNMQFNNLQHIRLYIVFFLCAAACTKEEITIYRAFIKNITVHQVKIIPYSQGTAPVSKHILLNPGDSLKVADGSDRGIVNHGGFHSDYLAGSDSIIVVFDNLYPVSHYITTPPSFAEKYYLYSSIRYIANYLSWEYSYRDISRYKREALYLYKFTEEDYLYSQ
jgi:hypothetical protein